VDGVQDKTTKRRKRRRRRSGGTGANAVQVYQRNQAERAPRIPGFRLPLGSFHFPRTASMRPDHVPLTLLVHRTAYYYTSSTPQAEYDSGHASLLPLSVGQSSCAESAPVSCQRVVHQRISLRARFDASALQPPAPAQELNSIATTTTVACAATVDAAAASALQRLDCVPRPAPSYSTALLASPPLQASHLSSRACTIVGKS
jgi:hypothetical protein